MHNFRGMNILNLDLVTAPATAIMTTATAKDYLRVTTSADDTLIDSLIVAARQSIEEFLERSLITQTWDMFLDHFPNGRIDQWWNGVREGDLRSITSASSVIEIPRAPLQSVTSVKTHDQTNTEATFSSSNYFVHTQGTPGRIILNSGNTWPTDLRDHAAVEIRFVAGYGDASTDIPDTILTAAKIIIMSLYENRGDCDDDSKPTIPKSARILLQPYKVMSLG